VAGRAQVSQFQRHVFAELVLNVERPLKNIRCSAPRVVSQHEGLAEARAGKARARKQLALEFPGIVERHIRPFQIRLAIGTAAEVAAHVKAHIADVLHVKDPEAGPHPLQIDVGREPDRAMAVQLRGRPRGEEVRRELAHRIDRQEPAGILEVQPVHVLAVRERRGLSLRGPLPPGGSALSGDCACATQGRRDASCGLPQGGESYGVAGPVR